MSSQVLMRDELEVAHKSGYVKVDNWVEKPLADFMKYIADTEVPREHRELAYLEWHWKKASLLSRRLLVLQREVAKMEGSRFEPLGEARRELKRFSHLPTAEHEVQELSNQFPSACSISTSVASSYSGRCNPVGYSKDSHFFDFMRYVDSRSDLDHSDKRGMVTAYVRQICFHLGDQISVLRRKRGRRSLLISRPLKSQSYRNALRAATKPNAPPFHAANKPNSPPFHAAKTPNSPPSVVSMSKCC